MSKKEERRGDGINKPMRENFLIRTELLTQFRKLTEAEAGRLIIGVMAWVWNHNAPAPEFTDPRAGFLYDMIMDALRRNWTEYDKKGAEISAERSERAKAQHARAAAMAEAMAAERAAAVERAEAERTPTVTAAKARGKAERAAAAKGTRGVLNA